MDGSGKQFSLALFYSLLNSSLRYDPIGWGLPYNHVMSTDYADETTFLSLQLLILLTHGPISNIEGDMKIFATESQEPEKHKKEIEFKQSKNVFLGYLKEINQIDEFKFIFDNIVRLLHNHVLAENTYLPGSTKQIEFQQELLILLWQLLLYNPVNFLIFFSNLTGI